MLKGKIKATVGLSASGKSTWAHSEWLKDPLNTVIIERDTIRNLLFGFDDKSISKYYELEDLNKLEKEVTKYQNTLIYDSLEQGKTVILSNTHLNRKRDLESLKYWNVPVEVKVFPITLKEALTRDMGRVRQVGDKVITKQYNRFVNLYKDLENNPIDFTPVELGNEGKEECYVFDIDGCLADNCGTRSPFDWGKVREDKPIKSVVKVLNELNYQNEWQIFTPIYICSGRDDICIEETISWFKKNVFNSDSFTFMLRKNKDSRPDWIVKQEMAKEICKTHTITAWWDDRLQVTRHLRALGLKVFNVEHNNF